MAAESKRVLLTGATGVVGTEVARLLAQAGYDLIFAARNTETAWALRKRLVAEHPEITIAVQELDLGSLYSVREFAATAMSRYETIDGIINGASVTLLPQRTLTTDRFEAHFGINHLGHFALNGLLTSIMPIDARIVTVTSPLAKFGKLRFHDLRQDHGYTPVKAYGTSKLANLLYTQHLHRLSRTGQNLVVSVAAHPGNVLLDGNPRFATLNPFLQKVGHSPADGAQVIFRAFTDPNAEGGEYYVPSGFQQLQGEAVATSIPRYADNPALQLRLWRMSGQLTRIVW